MTTPTYNPAEIEQQAQSYWSEQQSFEVKEDITKEKYYCLSMLPYPSGELHMGHVRNYTIGDVITRYQMMLGKNVLQPMGWDAFGLPAENAALKHQLAPSVWTYKNIDQMRKQLLRLGFAIDWKREVTTCQPSYYRWEQWLFTRLFKKGLAYKKNSVVNWDPIDQTVLANEQVVDGRGWRSGALVERKEISQWFLKITSYADELLQGLEILDGWPEQVRAMQRNWIGRSEGVEITFDVINNKEALSVYTTRPDTLLGATYLAIAPEHALAHKAAESNPKIAAFIQSCQNIKVSEAELATLEKRGMDTGFKAKHPLTGELLPIWVANYVLMEYGSGAVMAVPAHDARDFEFAQYYQLPMHIVIKPADGSEWNFKAKAFTDAGIMVDSHNYTGMHSLAAKDAIIEKLIALQKGVRKIHYRLRDWGVSRQRYWGTPIPIIYCDACGTLPVPEQDLPVVLPENIVLHEPSSPLKHLESFYQTTCPQCGSPATRETDTFDTFVESSWYYARYSCNDQSKAMLDDRVRYWTPVDQYIGGIEHAVMHLLYARFFHKILRDEGLVDSDEPFIRLLTQGMVLKDGAKMSKSKGNTVSPELLIEQYGVDTARLFSMFAAPPDQSLEWSDSGVEGAHRFLKRLWTYAQSIKEVIRDHLLRQERIDWKLLTPEQQTIRREIHEVLQQANQDMERQQFNTVVSAAMKIFNLLSKIELKSESDIAVASEGLSILLRILSPITPHICHALWRELGYGDDILKAGWPKVDHKAMKTSTITLVVQVNGKLRGQITVEADADQRKIEELAQQDPHVLRAVDNKPIKKIIVVPKKLVNIVV
jgi:leucyl-tRNA synthetase